MQFTQFENLDLDSDAGRYEFRNHVKALADQITDQARVLTGYWDGTTPLAPDTPDKVAFHQARLLQSVHFFGRLEEAYKESKSASEFLSLHKHNYSGPAIRALDRAKLVIEWFQLPKVL